MSSKLFRKVIGTGFLDVPITEKTDTLIALLTSSLLKDAAVKARRPGGIESIISRKLKKHFKMV